MRAYVGVTDSDWYLQLSARGATEVNFWQPSGGRSFRAIEQGAPFAFKTHYRGTPPNQIVGVGFFSGWASLPVSRAWEFFGLDNGCSSEAEMRARVSRYRRSRVPERDPEIGCIMLRDVAFLPVDDALPAPPDWSPNIVSGKTYEISTEAASPFESLLIELLARTASSQAGGPGTVDGPVFGDPRLRPVRLGQGAFKALVQEAYGRRCAITGDRIVPVLQAAHIRPVTDHGEHRVDNGLLLRSDVHTLFDRGYLGVHPTRRTLMVSPRLRADWGNGEEFYARASSAEPIALPRRLADQPNHDFLQWHADSLFLAS